jgi:hypothetical protein
MDEQQSRAEEDRLNADIRRHHIKTELRRAERKEWKELRSHLGRDLFFIFAGSILVVLVLAVVILTEWKT